MNAYIADQIAREHNDWLVRDAAAARRARGVSRARRTATKSRSGSADRSRPAAARSGTVAAAHFVARPFTAVRSWLLAG